MVVMKEVRGLDLTGIPSPPQCVLDDVTSALETLHEENLVFGDLRPPNILAVQDEFGQVIGGMLIDFDWCGTAGQAKYPYNINPVVGWPEGVRPGVVISMAHDLAMRERLSDGSPRGINMPVTTTEDGSDGVLDLETKFLVLGEANRSCQDRLGWRSTIPTTTFDHSGIETGSQRMVQPLY
ncbi:hypothetical protein FRC11_002708 [Ceratobasidium sp. 423]|nr:hypothetical protein FRC11_002708 [Ceratobasidium sp. 423]